VWWTTAPVVVGAEAGPEREAQGATLEVYPNPSGGAFTISLTLVEAADVEVAVYDVLGRRVRTLHTGPLASGVRVFSFNAADLPAGAYFTRAESRVFVLNAPIALVR
jgi:hypothetical protein